MLVKEHNCENEKPVGMDWDKLVTLAASPHGRLQLRSRGLLQQVLDALEKVAMESLKASGEFRLSFLTAQLCKRGARAAGEKRVCGREIKLKAKPERRVLKLMRIHDGRRRRHERRR